MTDTSREEKNQVFAQVSAPAPKTGYEVPVDSVPLPSRGQVYPIDHPLYNEQYIDIKCMTANEENLLSSQALIKNGTVLSKLLESCILNKTLNPDSMLTGDRNAVFMALRMSGYGIDYEVKISCPECSEDFEHVFDLSKIEIKPLTIAPMEPGVNMFSFRLPVSGKTVIFKLLTGADELALSRASKGRKKISSQVESGVTDRLQQAILSIDGVRDPQKLVHAVKNMVVGDSRAIRKYMDEVEPGMVMKQDVICPLCNEESEVRVPFALTFFWPDASL
jgi:hypothetical protein